MLLLLAAGVAYATSHPRPALATAASPPSAAAAAQSFIVDLSWIDQNDGWALSGVPCGQALCARLGRTDDGGRTWAKLPNPPVRLSAPGCDPLRCVAHLRFATASIGYLFGPSLFMTRDGGLTWSRVPGSQVESLEPGPGSVVRVVYDHAGCPGPCHRAVQEAAPGSQHWRVLLAKLPARAESAVNAQVIRATPNVMYVPVYGDLASGASASQQTTIFRSLDGGRSWVALADPCGGSRRSERDAIDVAAAPGGFVAALCSLRSHGGASSVVTSADDGRTWGPRRAVASPSRFEPDLIATPAAGDLVLSNSLANGSGPFTYELWQSRDDGRTWSTVARDREQLSSDSPYASFLGFEDASIGRWVGDPHAVWSTVDGGRHWTRHAFK